MHGKFSLRFTLRIGVGTWGLSIPRELKALIEPKVECCSARLFYSFNLDDHIPSVHLLRGIYRGLDLSDLRHYFADY